MDEDADRLERLERLSRLEADQNRDDSAIYFGRELHFSDAFQLLHVKSNRYLKVFLENAADAEGNRVMVRLSDDGSASCFRFQSRHNLKLADESVSDLEPVSIALESLTSTHRLNCSFNMNTIVDSLVPETKHMVSAFGAGICFIVQCYSREQRMQAKGGTKILGQQQQQQQQHQQQQQQKGLADEGYDRSVEAPVYCGRVVRLLHTERDVFLATAPHQKHATEGGGHKDSLVVLVPAAAFDQPGGQTGGTFVEPPSAYTLWLIESADPADGSVLRCVKGDYLAWGV